MIKVWQGSDGTVYLESDDGSKTFMDFCDDSPDGVIVYRNGGDGPEPIGEFDLGDLRNFLSVIDDWMEV